MYLVGYNNGQKHVYTATGGAVAVSLVMSKRENNTNPGVVYMNEAFHAIPHYSCLLYTSDAADE